MYQRIMHQSFGIVKIQSNLYSDVRYKINNYGQNYYFSLCIVILIYIRVVSNYTSCSVSNLDNWPSTINVDSLTQGRRKQLSIGQAKIL